MKKTILAMALLTTTACSATFDADAERSCYAVFDAWDEAAKGCALEATMPDPGKICWRAYDVDEGNLAGCLGWIRSQACEEYDNAHFQQHCGEAIYLRTW